MKRVYQTAQGKKVDLDTLLLSNEQTIAVGNMNVNARGDELGPGGKVVTKRNVTMNDYYKLNTGIATKSNPAINDEIKSIKNVHRDNGIHNKTGKTQTSDPKNEEIDLSQTTDQRQLRGNLADAVAKETVVDQPEINVGQTKGPQRI